MISKVHHIVFRKSSYSFFQTNTMNYWGLTYVSNLTHQEEIRPLDETIQDLLKEFEGKLKAEAIVFQFIETDKCCDIKDMITYTIAKLRIAG